MYQLKNKCVKKIIECEERGENVLCSFSDDKLKRGVFNVGIPNYFAPFEVHAHKNEEIDAEIIKKYQHRSPYLEHCFEMIFPFKISDKQKELLDYIIENATEEEIQQLGGKRIRF